MTNDQAPMTNKIQNPKSKIQNRERLRPIIASCFGLGCSPIMPGTCGALLGPAIYIPLALVVTSEPLQTALIAVCVLAWCWITVALGGWAETYYGKKDSQIFVTD